MGRLTSWLLAYRPISAEISYQFDALRGFSALLVLLTHTYLIFLYPVSQPLMPVIYFIGHSSVMALFALSGFLICKSASHNMQRNGDFSLRQYTVSRLNRILPPFYFGCLLLLLLYMLSPYVFASGSREFMAVSPVMSQAKMTLESHSFLGTLFFVNGFLTATPASNFSFWSLSFEMWFYILFGLWLAINRLSTSHRPVKKWLGLLGVMLLLTTLSWLNFSFFCYSFVWLGGVVVALLHHQQLVFRRSVLVCLVSACLPIVILGGGYWFWLMPVNADKNNVLLTILGSVSGLLICALLYCVVYNRVLLRLPGYRFAGSSYTLYILHFPLLLFSYGILQPYVYLNIWWLFGLASLSAGLCLLISVWLARYLERVKWLR